MLSTSISCLSNTFSGSCPDDFTRSNSRVVINSPMTLGTVNIFTVFVTELLSGSLQEVPEAARVLEALTGTPPQFP